MIAATTPLLLGSGSPRRRELLATVRIPFIVASADIDETPRDGEDPGSYLARVVRDKLASVGPVARSRNAGAVLVADTIVLLDDVILGKPADVAEAASMIRRLSGRMHEVWSRFAIARPADPTVPAHEQTVRTRVFFRRLDEREVMGYASSGEGLDKAGAYAVQGLGAFAVERIEGSYPNVVGLPVCEVVLALERLGLLREFPA